MLKLEKLTDSKEINTVIQNDKNHDVIVAKDGGEIIGYCVYNANQNVCNIINVNVDDENDHGLIDGLIRTAMFISQKAGCEEVEYDMSISSDFLIKYNLINPEQILPQRLGGEIILANRKANINEVLTRECAGGCI